MNVDHISRDNLPKEFQGRIIHPGDELYVFTASFYVKARVVEVYYIFLTEDDKTIWRDNLEEIPEDLNLKLVNQFPWTDWPTGGHAAYFDDDSFFTLEDARKRHGRFPKHKKHRRARNYLNSMGQGYRNKQEVRKIYT